MSLRKYKKWIKLTSLIISFVATTLIYILTRVYDDYAIYPHLITIFKGVSSLFTKSDTALIAVAAILDAVAVGLILWTYRLDISIKLGITTILGETGKYLSNKFVETRPISTGSEMSEEAYHRARSKYELRLTQRYHAEELIKYENKTQPIAILFAHPLEKQQVESKFDLDKSGHVRRYELPLVVREWGDEFLTFMKKHPFVDPGEGEPLRNGDMYHLEDYEDSNGKLTLWFQQSKYFEYIQTDLAMDVRRKNESKTLRDFLEPAEDGRLKTIKQSDCAGELGICCIVKSSDGLFVVTERSERVTHAKGMFAPSASGGLRPDGKVRFNTPPSIFRGAIQQLWEEMAVKPEHVKHMIFLGITRELERGGKADGHFYVESNRTFEKLVEQRTEAIHLREHKKYIPVKPREITSYINNENSSPALKGCVYLFHKLIDSKL